MPHLIIHVSNLMDEGAKVAFLKRTREVVIETLRHEEIFGLAACAGGQLLLELPRNRQHLRTQKLKLFLLR